jgi:hypothetical protein
MQGVPAWLSAGLTPKGSGQIKIKQLATPVSDRLPPHTCAPLALEPSLVQDTQSCRPRPLPSVYFDTQCVYGLKVTPSHKPT